MSDCLRSVVFDVMSACLALVSGVVLAVVVPMRGWLPEQGSVELVPAIDWHWGDWLGLIV